MSGNMGLAAPDKRTFVDIVVHKVMNSVANGRDSHEAFFFEVPSENNRMTSTPIVSKAAPHVSICSRRVQAAS